jgi:hypothetical protein
LKITELAGLVKTALGAGVREFKSRRPDQIQSTMAYRLLPIYELDGLHTFHGIVRAASVITSKPANDDQCKTGQRSD